MRAQFIFEFSANVKSKYYAPEWLVKFAVQKSLEIIGPENISEIIEPAAGDGAFIPYLEQVKAQYGIPTYYSDLNPDTDYYLDDPSQPKIETEDFLKMDLPFDPNRLILTGPPYGDRKNDPTSTKLWPQFAQKASEIAGYAAFISPVTWLTRKNPVPNLELIRAYNLGTVVFKGSKVFKGKDHPIKTAFLIYKTIQGSEKEDFSMVDADFEITTFRGKDHFRKKSFEYYVLSWGKYYSGMVNTTGIYPAGSRKAGKPFSKAIGINVKTESKRPELEEFLRTFRKDHIQEIERSSITTSNSFELQQFKKWVKEALY